MCGQGKEGHLEGAVSSFVCRCGPSIRGFGTCVPLSEAAIHHLMQLPNLSHWTTAQGPPQVIPTSIFPSLENLRLDSRGALPWLHLPPTLRNGPAPVTSYTNIREIIKSLDCSWGAIVDSTLLSPIVKFRNLVALRVRADDCYGMEGCSFRLTDDDIEDLATALPRLKLLRLGRPCQSNTCNTTVASLIAISVRCPDLTVLETHINTLTIADDIRRLLDGGAGRNQTKCKLHSFLVGDLSLKVRGEDIETIAMGFKAIFPCLMKIRDSSGYWQQLKSKLDCAVDTDAHFF